MRHSIRRFMRTWPPVERVAASGKSPRLRDPGSTMPSWPSSTIRGSSALATTASICRMRTASPFSNWPPGTPRLRPPTRCARLAEANKAIHWARGALPKYSELEQTISVFCRTRDLSHRRHVRRSGIGIRARRHDCEWWQLPQRAALGNAMRAVGTAQARLAEKARRASRSVSGSPSPGGSSGSRRDSSIEDDVRAAVRSAAGRI